MMHDQPKPVIARAVQGPVSRRLRPFISFEAHESGPSLGQFELMILEQSWSVFVTADELRAYAQELLDAANGLQEIGEKGNR